MFQEFVAFCITQNTCNHFLIYRHAYESGPTVCQVIPMTEHIGTARLKDANFYLRMDQNWRILLCIAEWANTIDRHFSYCKIDRLNFLLQNGPKLWSPRCAPRIFQWRQERSWLWGYGNIIYVQFWKLCHIHHVCNCICIHTNITTCSMTHSPNLHHNSNYLLGFSNFM
jgi:hypothetical protein